MNLKYFRLQVSKLETTPLRTDNPAVGNSRNSYTTP
jgi:hypothetical protein